MASQHLTPAMDDSMTRVERYRKFLYDEKLADVTFLVGTKKVPVKANKVILRFGSKVFDEMFGNPESNQDFYKVLDLEPEEFWKFLEYLYTGELANDFKDAGLMLKGAIRYGVVDLVKLCVKKLIDTLSIESCGTTLSLAIETKNEELQNASIAFICKSENANAIFGYTISQNVNNLAREDLIRLGVRQFIHLPHQMDMKTIPFVKWGKAEVAKTYPTQADNPKYLRSTLENIIKYVRFPLIKPSDFSTKVDKQQLLTMEETMSVLLYFNVEDKDRSTYESRIFNSKPRNTNTMKPLQRLCKNTRFKCQQYGERYLAVLQPDGRYHCTLCRFETNNYP